MLWTVVSKIVLKIFYWNSLKFSQLYWTLFWTIWMNLALSCFDLLIPTSSLLLPVFLLFFFLNLFTVLLMVLEWTLKTQTRVWRLVQFLKPWMIFFPLTIANFRKHCIWRKTILTRSLSSWITQEFFGDSYDKWCQDGEMSYLKIWTKETQSI